jgi:hypothetical protein
VSGAPDSSERSPQCGRTRAGKSPERAPPKGMPGPAGKVPGKVPAPPSHQCRAGVSGVPPELNRDSIDREANPERNSEELGVAKMGACTRREEYSHHGPGSCNAEQDANSIGSTTHVFALRHRESPTRRHRSVRPGNKYRIRGPHCVPPIPRLQSCSEKAPAAKTASSTQGRQALA